MIENKKNNNNFSFTKENLLLAERELKKYPKGREGSAIISILWIAQRQNKGWLSSDIIDYIAKFLDLPQIRVMEIATFYTMFNLNPVGAHHFQICGTTPCMLSGSEKLKSLLREEIGEPILEWGDLEKTRGTFNLKTEHGKVHSSEVVGVVGPNATGKTTMVKMIAGELEMDGGWCTMEAKVSYKPQHVKPEFAGSVQLWLDSELGMKWRQGEFHTTVIRPLQVDKLIEQDVRRLSGGELQAVSIAICLGKEADLYLLDEPSAHLDANARMEAAKAIRKTMEVNEKAAMVIDHDIYFIDIVSDSLLVFEGEGGVSGKAIGPLPLRTGMNRFLEQVEITFRRDHDSHRPRINKLDSRKDREQKSSGEYFYAG